MGLASGAQGANVFGTAAANAKEHTGQITNTIAPGARGSWLCKNFCQKKLLRSWLSSLE